MNCRTIRVGSVRGISDEVSNCTWVAWFNDDLIRGGATAMEKFRPHKSCSCWVCRHGPLRKPKMRVQERKFRKIGKESIRDFINGKKDHAEVFPISTPRD